MQDPRERLLRRVEVEARAFANSDGTTSQLRLGRVQGLLEAGVLAGYWCKKDSAAAAELVQHRYRISKLRDVLLRGDEVKLWKVTDIAEFLGVSTQRVDQLALAGRSRHPSGRLGRARYWERSGVEVCGGQTGGQAMAVAGDTGDRRQGISPLEAFRSTGSSWPGTRCQASRRRPDLQAVRVAADVRPVLP